VTLTVFQVPDDNRTQLGLYVTPQEAYDQWKASPSEVNIVDVRTFEEYIFGGHPEMARNIPFMFPKFEKSSDNGMQGAVAPGGRPPGCKGAINPDFVATIKKFYQPTDTIFITCATGARGAPAVNTLAQAGFTKVYNVINGFEGDKVTDAGSVFFGKRMRNGWKNLGPPWGYSFDPDLMWENAAQ
jgi:rhodanese-related sulfurtransferase